MIAYSCTDDIDVEEFQETITDSFNPGFDLPEGGLISLTRITEIRSLEMTGEETGSGTRFIYESDNTHYCNMGFIWNFQWCSSSVLLKWSESTTVSTAYVGNTQEGFRPMEESDIDRFMQGSDKWIFRYDEALNLKKVYLEENPETYRTFEYQPHDADFSYHSLQQGDFFDSIVEYQEGEYQRILKYQYAPDGYELIAISELDKTGNTVANYTFKREDLAGGDYLYNNLFIKNSLFGIPGAPCSYTFLYGPLSVWHFPFPLKKLFRNGELVYEANYSYNTSDFPYRVDYRRWDDVGTMSEYSEEIFSEVITY